MANDITAAEAAQIDKMNVASQRAELGTVVEELQAEVGTIRTGSQAATYADIDGSAIEILTGTTGIIGYIVNVSVSGSIVTSFTRNTGSNLVITPITTGSMSTWTAIAEDDRVDWLAF